MMLLFMDIYKTFMIGFLSSVSRGLDFGYFSELSKSFLLVSEKHKSAAQQLFDDFGIQVVTIHHFLGGYLGEHSGWV